VSDRNTLLEDIWRDDLLERKQLAQQLEDYIAARFASPAPGGGSFTIAVEGPYGQGKSFLLDRLAKQLALSHPVAVVNAWADDTANDPLTSLFLAIEQGIAEKVRTQPPEKKAEIVGKVKSVAKIAAKVAVRAAGSWLLSSQGVAELESAFEAGVDDAFDLKNENVKDTPLVSRRALISEFRELLSSLLDTLETDGLFNRPLIVIIDELDRCRPTYAIRVLEEAKHFFDDTGTVFVYGMNRAALAATVRSIYGATFPAEHYLARFVRRQVQLPDTSLQQLIQAQFHANTLLVERFMFPNQDGDNAPEMIVPWVVELFRLNSIHARDAEYILEYLFSFAAMWGHEVKIQIPYLSIIAVDRYKREREGEAPLRTLTPPLHLLEDGSVLMRYQQISSWTNSQMINSARKPDNLNPIIQAVLKEWRVRFPQGHLADLPEISSYLKEYGERLETVGKFLNVVTSEE
jgi:KAP family P-loop domain